PVGLVRWDSTYAPWGSSVKRTNRDSTPRTSNHVGVLVACESQLRPDSSRWFRKREDQTTSKERVLGVVSWIVSPRFWHHFICGVRATAQVLEMSLMKQLLLDLVAAPVVACLWWLFSRGWGLTVQGGQVSDR